MVDAPKRALLDDLAGPPGSVRWRSRGGPGEPVAESVGGGNPFWADLATVRFVKERATERRRLYSVTFEGVSMLDPRRMRRRFAWVLPVERYAGAWRTAGGSGGSDDELLVSEPRVNLGGGGPPGFYAGGRVLTAGIDVALVRLTCANQLVLEDDTEGGVVLFITEEPARLPATADLYDRAGRRVSTHEALNRLIQASPSPTYGAPADPTAARVCAIGRRRRRPSVSLMRRALGRY